MSELPHIIILPLYLIKRIIENKFPTKNAAVPDARITLHNYLTFLLYKIVSENRCFPLKIQLYQMPELPHIIILPFYLLKTYLRKEVLY